ncbi:MAG TPA: DUF4245 domain-containing protein [Micromonosporaceae bacterium]
MTSQGAPRASDRRPRDLVLSLAVLLVPILLVVLLFQYLGADDEVTVVDPGPAFSQARDAGLDVVRPGDLPAGWRPVSAVLREDAGAVTLRVGYVTSGGGFLQLVESDRDAEPLLRRELGDGRPGGTEPIGGVPWQAYPGRDGERALVWLEPERTVLVLGRAPASEMRTLAASLR